MPKSLRLISHKLCPYVQRAVIVATEKDIPLHRIDIDLANKPDWFLAISPTGKVPLLEVTEHDGSTRFIFESAVIAEYLDEIAGQRLLPANPAERARERSWVQYSAQALADIYRLYTARTRRGSRPSAMPSQPSSSGSRTRSPVHGSTATSSASSTPHSAPCSAISMCSTGAWGGR